MALKAGTPWYFTVGLSGGITLAYLLSVLLGVWLPSWPFNALFTPLAVLSLALQTPYLWRPQAANLASWRLGALLGAAVLALAWLLYGYGGAL